MNDNIITKQPRFFWRNICIILILFYARCSAQETPTFDTITWEVGANHRNNFCARYEAVEKGQMKLRDALKGLNISTAVMNYMLDQETGSIDKSNPVMSFRVLDEVARRADFTYRNAYGVLESPTGNNTWSDILDWAVDTYDIMSEWFLETTDRLERGILFPQSWYNGNIILVMRKDTKNVGGLDMWGFTQPFTRAVWILIAVVTVFSGIIYYIIDYIDSRLEKKKMDVGLEESVFYAAFAFNGHLVHEPKSRSTRIFVFSMAFFYLLIVAAYTANLASFLVEKNKGKIVINDVQDAIRNELTFCVWKGTGMDEILQNYNLPKSKIHRTPNNGDEYLALLEGKCDIIFTTSGDWEMQRRDVKYNPDCNLELVGRIVKMQPAGFAVRDSEQYCTSLLRNVFDLHISEMKNDLTLQNLWENHLDNGATNMCAEARASANNQKEDDGKLTISNMSSIFVWHISAIMAALFFTLFRVWRQPQHQKLAMLTEVKSALGGGRGLSKSVTLAMLRPSIIRNNSSRVTVKIEREEESPEEKIEVGHEHYEKNVHFDGNEKFYSSCKLSEKIEKMYNDMEETSRQHREEIKRRDGQHQDFLHAMYESMEKKDEEHKFFIEAMIKKHQEEMKKKDELFKELIISLQKDQFSAIIGTIQNSNHTE